MVKLTVESSIPVNFNIESEVTPPSSAQLVIDGLAVKREGNPYPLIGVQTDFNSFKQANGQYYTVDDVVNIKNHGGKIIEVNMNLLYLYLPSATTIDEQAVINNLDVFATWAEQNQIYFILTFNNMKHSWAVPYWMVQGMDLSQFEIEFYDLSKAQHDTARQAVINFWIFLANRYKDNPYILFDFFNEPFYGNVFVNSYWNQSAYIDPISQNYVNFITTLIDAVRSTGAKNLIIVDSPVTYLHPDVTKFSIDRDVIWEAHRYVGYEKYQNNPQVELSDWKADVDYFINLYAYRFGKPLFFGEYGFIDAGSMPEIGNFFPNWQNILQEQVEYLKNSLFCGYAWHVYNCLDGEWYDHYAESQGKDCFTAQESEWLLNTILS